MPKCSKRIWHLLDSDWDRFKAEIVLHVLFCCINPGVVFQRFRIWGCVLCGSCAVWTSCGLLGSGPGSPSHRSFCLVPVEPQFLVSICFYMFLYVSIISIHIPFYHIFPPVSCLFHQAVADVTPRRRSSGAAPPATSGRGWAKLRAQRHCGSLLLLGSCGIVPERIFI